MKPRTSDLILFGPHTVAEALSSKRTRLREILIRQGVQERRLTTLLEDAGRAGVRILVLDPREFQRRYPDRHAQGIVALAESFPYETIDARLDKATPQDLWVLLDHLLDPRNVGAIIRTAFALGCAAVVLPKDRAAQITETVIRTSAGSAWHIPIVLVSNMAQSITALQSSGFRVIGADPRGLPLESTSIDAQEPLALVVGEEGEGLRELTKKRCDSLVSISQDPRLDSMNVSVAAAIMLYEFAKQKRQHG